MSVTLDHLRQFAVARSLFKPTTLKRALDRLGFVQADPIRAPARAQDLILRHRVKDYSVGDLERLYPRLGIEEDFFVVYGFLTRRIQRLMHPRVNAGVPAEGSRPWSAAQENQSRLLLKFVRKHGEARPRDVDRYFSHGSVRNYWGGVSNATTHLLAAMHYRGLLRVARRERGVRVYAEQPYAIESADAAERRARLDVLIDVAVRIYAPLPGPCLSDLVRRLRFAVPQWRSELKNALQRAKQRLSHRRVEGVDWYWPMEEDIIVVERPTAVRLLTPFDPVVWDRDRFELLWGWLYRFEAYTPAPKRKLGYYAMPLLWRENVIGWANVSVENGRLKPEFGYIASRPPSDRCFKHELEAELARMRCFLSIGDKHLI